MKNVRAIFLKGLWVIGLFSLVLGFSLISSSQVKAEILMVSVEMGASPGTISCGQSTHLNWTSTNATTITINPGIGSVNPYGDLDVSPTQTTTYTITGSNTTGGYGTGSITVNVAGSCSTPIQQPTVNLTADNYSVNYNDSTIVRWYSNNATSCNASGGTNGWYGNRATSGSFNTGGLANSTTYSITCTNGYGSAYDSVTVSVSNYQTQYPIYQYQTFQYQPIVAISADQTNIPYNGSTNIRWTSLYATSCFASNGSTGWAGAKNIGSGNFYTGSLTTGRTYTITCSNSYGSATDSVSVNVRGQIVTTVPTTLTSLVTITSSVDRSQPIIPTIDNTRPHPGDEINYTVSYKNIGTGAITNLSLRIDLPLEVDYISSSPNNPTISGNTLVFKLGTLRANGQGTVTVKVRVRDNVPAGTNLNFPATLSYIDPSGSPQSVSANVSAQVWTETVTVSEDVRLGAGAFGSGFFPANLFGWLLLLILILILVFIAKYIFDKSFRDKTTTTIQR